MKSAVAQSALIASASVFTGCMTYWTKPGITEAEWNRDRYECERDMRQAGYFGSGIAGQINAQSFLKNALSARGYYRQVGPKSQRLLRRAKRSPGARVANATANGPKKQQIGAWKSCALTAASPTNSLKRNAPKSFWRRISDFNFSGGDSHRGEVVAGDLHGRHSCTALVAADCGDAITIRDTPTRRATDRSHPHPKSSPDQ